MKGSFSLVHRRRLRLAFRSQLLKQNVLVPSTSYRWRHAGMFIRRIGLQHYRSPLRLWLRPRIC